MVRKTSCAMFTKSQLIYINVAITQDENAFTLFHKKFHKKFYKQIHALSRVFIAWVIISNVLEHGVL
jgi:hypothetical protein